MELEALTQDSVNRGDPTKLTIHFNRSLLNGEAVEVQPYGLPATDQAATTSSTLRILVDARYWSNNTVLRCAKNEAPCKAHEWFCMDEDAPNEGKCGSGLECGKGRLQATLMPASTLSSEPWIEVDLAAGANPNEVIVDLSKLNGSQPLALHYGWASDQSSCCVNGNQEKPCVPGSCPLIGKMSRLPANPFIAQLVDGSCSCVPPQRCDGGISNTISFV